MSTQAQTQAQEKKQKLFYIMEHCADNGYDTTAFNKYFSEKYNSQLDVDGLSFAQVEQIVADFKALKGESEWADLSEFDKQFESVDNAKPKTQDSQKVTQIAQIKTELNEPDVRIKLTGFEIKKGGVFVRDKVFYQVETEIPGHTYKYMVQRKDSDFYALRKILAQLFPYVMVPALPPKLTTISQSAIEKRQQAYSRLLKAVSKSEVLKSSKFMVQFLKIADRPDWKSVKHYYEKVKFSRNIKDVVSLTGEINVEERHSPREFCSRVKSVIDEYSGLTREAITLSREVFQKSEALAQNILKLAECYESLGNFNKRMKIQSQYKLFQKLSSLLYSQSLNLQNQGELTRIYCGQAVKYYEHEHEPLAELLANRDSYKFDFLKQLDKLNEKKSHLFRNKDFGQWGYTFGTLDEMVSRSAVLKSNRREAYKYMLSDETQRLQTKQEELNFHTNQVYDECQRVGRNNGETLIEHFMTCNSIQQRYTEQHLQKLAEFQDYFGNFKWERAKSKKKPKKKKAEVVDDFAIVTSDAFVVSSDSEQDPPDESTTTTQPSPTEAHTATEPDIYQEVQKEIREVNISTQAGHESSSVPSTAPSSQKPSVVTQPVELIETTIRFSTEPPTIINLQPLRDRRTNLNPKGILKNAIKQVLVEPTSIENQFQPLKRDSFSRPSRTSIRGSLAQARSSFELQKEPSSKEETKEPTLTFDNLLNGEDISDMSQLEKQERASVVADLLETNNENILSQAQLDKLKFTEQISHQANNLVPAGSRQTGKISAKVAQYLQQKEEQNVRVKINPGLRRQITKMISVRLELNSSDEYEESSSSSSAQ